MKIVDLFFSLVKIDSPSGEEQLISKHIINWLKNYNFYFKIDQVGNIYARNRKVGQPILFSAHLDTVEPGRAIEPILKNNIIKVKSHTILGADNKAALAAILYTIPTFINTRPIELIFTVKEETGGGIEYFPFFWIKSKFGFIFDSAKPIGSIILRSPYIYNFKAEFFGKPAHASTPKKGKNAFIPAIQALSKITIGELDNKETTINIGKIIGGVGINTIPPQITVLGEVRSYQKHLFEKHIEKINYLFMQESVDNKIKFKFSLDGYCPGYTHKKTDPLIKKIKSIFKQNDIKPKYYRYSGISDANILNAKGIKTINLGDGVENPHTEKEQIAVSDLNQLNKIISKIIKSI